MTRLQRWLIERIARRMVLQGFHHRERITEFYGVLIAAACEEFTEDNKPTLDAFLRECHETALGASEKDRGSDAQEERTCAPCGFGPEWPGAGPAR